MKAAGPDQQITTEKGKKMALSLTELDQQGAEFLPAREVMSTCGGRRRKHYGGGD